MYAPNFSRGPAFPWEHLSGHLSAPGVWPWDELGHFEGDFELPETMTRLMAHFRAGPTPSAFFPIMGIGDELFVVIFVLWPMMLMPLIFL